MFKKKDSNIDKEKLKEVEKIADVIFKTSNALDDVLNKFKYMFSNIKLQNENGELDKDIENLYNNGKRIKVLQHKFRSKPLTQFFVEFIEKDNALNGFIIALNSLVMVGNNKMSCRIDLFNTNKPE